MSGDNNQKDYNFLSKARVIRIYRDLMQKYGQTPTIRQEDLLDSALAAAKNIAYYENQADVYDIAAGYCYYICRNHPFVDGNKRMALFTMSYFLRKHSLKIKSEPEELEKVIRNIAAGNMNRKSLAEWLKENTRDI